VQRILGLILALLTISSGVALYVGSHRGADEKSQMERMERMEPRTSGPDFDEVFVAPVPAGRSLPPINRVVNDPSGEGVDVLQSEVSIAVCGDTIVIGWNDGAAFESETNTGTGYGYSVDRGDTWTDGGSVPWGSTALPFGDPTLAVTSDGQWILASLDAGDSPVGLAISRGHFSGSDLALTTEQYSDGGFLDKEYFDYDAALDRLYLTYRADTGRLTRSDDGGDTWSTPVFVAGGINPNGFYPTAGVDGEVYVTWLDPLGMPSSTVHCRYSSDGGSSWAGPAVDVTQLGPNSNTAPVCFNRGFNPLNPSAAVDRSDGPNRGRFYLTWTDGAGGEFDCFFAYSDDKGQSFSTPIQLNDNTNLTEQFWSQITLGPDGRISVGWYDRRNSDSNLLCDYYCTQSVDGGLTWGPNRRVSDLSVGWCGVPSNAAPNFGDYTEITSDDRSLFCVWSDARLGGPDVVFARVDDHFTLLVDGESDPAEAYTGSGDVWFVPNETEFTISPAPMLESEAEGALASAVLALLATPAEEEGVFGVGGESVSGSLDLIHDGDNIAGTFALAKTGNSQIALGFTASSSVGLGGIDFDDEWTTQANWTSGGDGQVLVTGTVEMSVAGAPFEFILSGIVNLDGAPGATLPEPLDWNQTASAASSLAAQGSSFTLHTRTIVEAGSPANVPELPVSSHPRPLAVVRATPNPVGPNTRITLALNQSVEGRIDVYTVAGRRVRHVADEVFESGFHEIPFDGRNDDGDLLPVGGYFVAFESTVTRSAGKMFVVGR